MYPIQPPVHSPMIPVIIVVFKFHANPRCSGYLLQYFHSFLHIYCGIYQNIRHIFVANRHTIRLRSVYRSACLRSAFDAALLAAHILPFGAAASAKHISLLFLDNFANNFLITEKFDRDDERWYTYRQAPELSYTNAELIN
jgi:hypothetical protein